MGYGEGIVPYDIVAGTFGASEFGGGANAVLSAFMLIVVAVLLALWNNKALSTAKLAVLALPLMVPIFVNESKVSLLYLMVIVGVIFKNEILALRAEIYQRVNGKPKYQCLQCTAFALLLFSTGSEGLSCILTSQLNS